MKNIFAIAGMLILSACSFDPKPVQVDPAARTVGVISVIPPELNIDTTGRNIFQGGNASEKISLSQWKINAAAEEDMRLALEPRYSVTKIPLPPGFGIWGDIYSSVPDIGEQIRQQVHGARVDLYIVLWMHPLGISPKASPPKRLGLGIALNDSLLFDAVPELYARVAVSVVDGRSFKVLDTTRLEAWENGNDNLTTLPKFAWQEHWYKFTDDQRALVLRTTEDLLKRSIQVTLKQMKLAAN